jgi:uncharacterized protein YdiU (UPF0061 family)
MNTDNSLISGETVDYGPCAFIDTYHPDTVFSSIDHGGRYCYRNQPGIAHWNLTMLAQALLPLIDKETSVSVEKAQEVINTFPEYFSEQHNSGLAKKFGLEELHESDKQMVDNFFEIMSKDELDFTLTFRYLSDLADETSLHPKIKVPDTTKNSLNSWFAGWLQRLGQEAVVKSDRQSMMYRANPAFIPRNHLVELAINEATLNQNYLVFESMKKVLTNPFEFNPSEALYAEPPRPDQIVRQTFCGT